MESAIIIAAVLVALFVCFILKEYFDSRRINKMRLEKAKSSYGKRSDRKYSDDELARIKTLTLRLSDPDTVDDITANDIDFDRLYTVYNRSLSSCGDEYFYYRLRTPVYDKSVLSDLEKKVSLLQSSESERNLLLAEFIKIGSMRNVNFFDCIDLCMELQAGNLLLQCVPLILFILGILAMIFFGGIGIAFFVSVIAFDIITYYKARGNIDIYFTCFKYIVNLLNTAKSVVKLKSGVIEDEQKELSESLSNLSGFMKISSYVTGKSTATTGAGNPLDVLMDYLKMVLHIDIIGFNLMLNSFQAGKDNIERVYITLGKAESYISIASMRECLPVWCVPAERSGLEAVNVYHPLIDEPVKNSISASNKGVLITGSNASGKSTFLKTVLINAIFSKSIHTCAADSFACDDYRIYSSMSLRDDLLSHDSYFMVEIKALKRILDRAGDEDKRPVLCFLDEVLRGTNTIERISACTVILKTLREAGVMCFAATHDLELTNLLSDHYDNYHFEETVTDNDITFNYRLNPGPGVTRNAIKLLGLMGFDNKIIDNANELARHFEETGRWR
ncbi:MAG: hypothetical protein K6E19_02365 [Lachnospiraceae bacterium]|nr:hypothetical protein [Lachnospiraceae bacterium]